MKITERIRGAETYSFTLLATFALALGLAPSAQAADYNLNGATVSITSDALKSDPYKGKTIINGTLNVSANQQFADGTITYPDWVKGVNVVDGEIVLDVKSCGMCVSVR